MKEHSLNSKIVLGMRVDASNYQEASKLLIDKAKSGDAAYVCVANVHMCMEAYDNIEFQAIVNNAFMVTSDGMPLVAALKMLGCKDAKRVYGPDLTLWMCEAAERENLSIALYGGTSESLADFDRFLQNRFPKLKIACKISPPFRELTEKEEEEYVHEIEKSGAQILFVGIGCPRQEKWMARHSKKLNVLMLGVGAAFDFHSGRVKQSPSWMQKLSLEWLFRLYMEPKRLWRRYLYHNPRFMMYFFWQYIRHQFRSNSS